MSRAVLDILKELAVTLVSEQVGPAIGDIKVTGLDVVEDGWVVAEGQSLAVSDYPDAAPLFARIYGSDAEGTFKVLDARGRNLRGVGSEQVPGFVGGFDTVTLNVDQLPKHSMELGEGVEGVTTVSLGTTISNPMNIPSASNRFVGASGLGQGTATIYSDALSDQTVELGGVKTTVGGSTDSIGEGKEIDITNAYVGVRVLICVKGRMPN